MNCPPTKRMRGLNRDVPTAMTFDDPFGDDEDFTQDDLDEIDIIASQAFTSAAPSGHGSKSGTKAAEPTGGSTSSMGQSASMSTATTNHSREKTTGFCTKILMTNREALGNRPQQFVSDREDAYSVLEAHQAELKRKLKEVEEDIMLKNGEIRVLRDSLKGALQEKEAQKQNQMVLEIQRQKEQSDREKEYNKKIQSLQSELQFKEAEINEMKNKLHGLDKNKTASPLPRNSPKVLSCLVHSHHGSCSSPSSSVAHEFITKETFSAHIPSKTPVKTCRDVGDRESSSSRTRDTQEMSSPDPFASRTPVHLQHRGGVLLGLLLQQPLSPSSIGLSHLLSMSLTSRGLSAGFLLQSGAAVSGKVSGATLSLVQRLAVTGLNMLSQSRPEVSASNRNKRSCSGAVLFLPLLDLHLSQLSQSLTPLYSSSSGGSNSATAPAGGTGRPEETGLSMEDVGLAALRLLYLLVTHSDEVVEVVLSKESQSRGAQKKDEHTAAAVDICSQNALLQSLLQLCEGSSSSQREKLVLSAMKTLCVLIERTPHAHSDRLRCVLQVICGCFSTDSRLQIVSGCVSVLTSLCDHPKLTQQLCSQHNPCVFLKLFQFIRTRRDNQETHRDGIQLDLQVVRLLSRLMTQKSDYWTTRQHSSCQCYTEVVQTVLTVFHRQWLDFHGSQELTDSIGLDPPQRCYSNPVQYWWRGTASSLLRECLMLLHWLVLHHGSFSESCRPLLHMYDQVIPAVRDTLRRIPELSESEELALEELCRSEGDDTDDMEADAVS